MATDLFTPILNTRTRAPNYFNGRLLTAEAMTEEQSAQRTARELLAQAVGDGVAYGLEVVTATSSTQSNPVVTVKRGVAVNRCGEALLLNENTDIQLVRPASTTLDPSTIFQTCTPISNGVYVADAGVYLLTISSIRAGNGLAQVSGLGDASRTCIIKDIVDAVELRLVSLPVDNTTLGDPAHLRNAIAYQCFGVSHLVDFATDPFATPNAQPSLLDQIRGTDLTDCDVPLAVLYWTATGGIEFVDMWPVRRRITKTHKSDPFALDDARVAVSEAMAAQFRDHLSAVISTATLDTFQAKSVFRWLPPAGLVPLSSTTGATGFNTLNFFSGKTWNQHTNWPAPIYMEGGMLETLLRISADYPPVDLNDKEMVWLYSVRENYRALHTGQSVQPYVVFANANLPFFGAPRADRAHWNYANFR